MSKKLRIGVVISHPTQYFSPLFDLLTRRDNIGLTVFYGNDAGARISRDEGFSLDVAWDIDLLDRYTYVMLTAGAKPSVAGRSRALARLVSGIRQLDVVVVHGYATPLAAAAIVVCKCFGVPYLLRSDTSRRDAHARLSPRAWWPRLVGSSCAGAMVVGVRNMDVQLALGVRRIFQVPFSIDVRRFAVTARSVRADARATRVGFGLPGVGPVVAFAGKFTDIKRAGDLVSVSRLLPAGTHIMMIGDGPNKARLRRAAKGLPVTFTGFLNQSQMPSALACADVIVLPSAVEPWGLIVNEAMACGCVPVVSDAVGCAPDLVHGVGREYAVGDLAGLASAIGLAVQDSRSTVVRRKIASKVALFDTEPVARSFEEAVIAVSRARDR